MVKNFSPSDADSRSLIAAVRLLGEGLGRESSSLKRDLHAKFYPGFGRVEGLVRRRIIMQFRPWESLFSQEAMELLHFSYDVEEKLIHSIASQSRADSLEILRALRERLDRLDRLLRATHRRISKFRSDTVLDTEQIYDFSRQTERIALYAQYLALILLRPPSSVQAITDPRFLGIDWSEVEAYADHWPQVVEVEVLTPTPPSAGYAHAPSLREPIRPNSGTRSGEILRKMRR